MRYLIKFSYDGTNFHGYQAQIGLRTVQGEIEKALSYINRNEKVIIQASGRTDAGVHALEQTATFDLNIDITLLKLKRAINSNIGKDIHVISAEIVDEEFHARYSVSSKEYMYLLNVGEYNPVERNHIFQYNKNLDVECLKRNIKDFEGEHDFRSFVCSEDKRVNTTRTILSTKVEIEGSIIKFTFIGNGFLKYQIRNMVGTLIWICEGRLNDGSINNIFLSKDREKAGKTAPPEGLYLKKVNY